jgi:hypothetical protein
MAEKEKGGVVWRYGGGRSGREREECKRKKILD